MALTKANSTRLFVSALLIIMCVPLVSIANAASDDIKTQAAPEDASNITIDDQTSYVIQDNSTTDSDGNPFLILERDNSTIAVDDDASTTEDTKSDGEPNLIATKTTPDNTAVLVAVTALVATIAVGAAAIVTLRRKR